MSKTPFEIEDLHKFIEHKAKSKTIIGKKQLSEKFENAISYLNNVYNKWFPKKTNFSDIHIAEQIFIKSVKSDYLKHWVKYQLLALIKSAQRAFFNVEYYMGSNPRTKYSKKFGCITEIIFEIMQFLDHASFYVEGQHAGYGWRIRRVLNSAEIFEGSKMLFERRIHEWHLGNFVITPTAIFLIRQSIEIRLKNAFGIHTILSKDGKILKVPGIIFLQFAKENISDVEFPIKFSVIEKVYNWTQHYIHGGFIPHLWEIEWAFHVLKPLFEPYIEDKDGKLIRYDRYGSVKIKQLFYNQAEEKIKKLLEPKFGADIIIRRVNDPEALLVK
ncbi:MAG: hypothetical protein Q8M71_03275 [Thermodesulfovibrionales bacterium]|nr:hypothetical protein [Thermodesulfovibrionales bacterium]